MGINIWLPIVVNLLILGIMVAGVFIGKKYGFKVEAIKTSILCALGVGIYFLSNVLTPLALNISFLAQAVIAGIISVASIKCLIIDILFMLVYTIISVIIRCVVNKKSKNVSTSITKKNKAKLVKPKGPTKEETRKLRKQQKEFIKAQKKQDRLLRKSALSTKSKVFGALLGLFCAIIVGFVVTLPLKPIFNDIANSSDIVAEMGKGYEYTPYGQLDKLTDIVERISK